MIYQLVVPSFLDADDDGFGDLSGLLARLDYLDWLGVDAVWLSPIYRSPFRDLGYDVSDFTDVDPALGSLDLFDELIAESHRRDLAVILDWVPAHTSSEHPWFVEAASSREAATREWYIWGDPSADGGVPNNWISVFGGSAWSWHAPTGQHYLHTFHPTQPDLNWHNPEVRAAMFATLEFWLERGVDGFRIDACCLLVKDPALRDNPPNPDFREGDGPDARLLPEHTRDQPGLHDTLADIRALTDRYGDRVLLGELYLPLEKVASFYGGERPELHLPMHMPLTWTEWSKKAMASAIGAYLDAVDGAGWPAIALASHDSPRMAARAGPAQARVAAVLLLTLPGTPTIYYGEEIGMRGVPIAPQQARDPQGRRTGRNRDPERTPMQWNGHEPNAGFTGADPWLPVPADFPDCNVLAQSRDPDSLLELYRRLIRLRRETPALHAGCFEPVDIDTPDVFAFVRRHDGGAVLVAVNFGDEPRQAAPDDATGTVAVSTHRDREGKAASGTLDLRPAEGLVIRLDRSDP